MTEMKIKAIAPWAGLKRNLPSYTEGERGSLF